MGRALSGAALVENVTRELEVVVVDELRVVATDQLTLVIAE